MIKGAALILVLALVFAWLGFGGFVDTAAVAMEMLFWIVVGISALLLVLGLTRYRD